MFEDYINKTLTIQFCPVPPGTPNVPTDRDGNPIYGVGCRLVFTEKNPSPIDRILAQVFPELVQQVFIETAVCHAGDIYNQNLGMKLSFIRTVNAAFPHPKGCTPAQRQDVRFNRRAVWEVFKTEFPYVIPVKIPKGSRLSPAIPRKPKTSPPSPANNPEVTA